MPETDLEGGKVVAGVIQQNLSDNCYEYNDQRLKISMTFGLSSFFQSESIEQCITMAEEALDEGKKSGKHCAVLSEKCSM